MQRTKPVSDDTDTQCDPTPRGLARSIGFLLALLAVCGFHLPAEAQDAIRGGRLYDKWWAVNGAAAPTGDHPLYPPVGQKSGNSTYRCKECHGWDYKGAAGAYGAGSHFTGIPGVAGSLLTPAEMFDIIKNPDGNGTGGTTVNGHDFGTIGLSDPDITDVVEFLQTLLIDPDLFLSGTSFIGDEVQGETDYTSNCASCHGSDGTAINFGTPEAPEWVGTVATGNPWELMHKVRLGQPGTAMPSWTGGGGTDQRVADMGKYIQLNFPTEPPPVAVPAASDASLIALCFALLTAGMLMMRVRRRGVRIES